MTRLPGRDLSRAVAAAGLLLALFEGCPPASAQAPQLEVSIQPLQESYVAYEPVYVRLRVENVGDVPYQLPSSLDADTQTTAYAISRDGETWRVVSPGYVREPVDMMTIAPGETVTHDQLLIWDGFSMTPMFPEVGTWKVTAQLGGADGFASNVLDLPFYEASGAEAEGSHVFGMPPVIGVAMNVEEQPEGMAALERLVEDYPDTSFGDYARVYLAQRWLQGAGDRSSDPRRAIAYLAPIAQDPTRAPQVRPLALQMLARAYGAVNEPSRAAEMYRRLLREHPEAPNAQGVAPLAEALDRVAAEMEQRSPATAPPVPARPARDAPPAPGGVEAGAGDRGSAGGGGLALWVVALVVLVVGVAVVIVRSRRRR